MTGGNEGRILGWKGGEKSWRGNLRFHDGAGGEGCETSAMQKFTSQRKGVGRDGHLSFPLKIPNFKASKFITKGRFLLFVVC